MNAIRFVKAESTGAAEVGRRLGMSTRFGRLNRLQEIGRRDWTRTNDPHHVKVVL